MKARFELPPDGHERLLGHWRGLFDRAAEPDRAARIDAAARALLARYDERHRAYHNASHVLALARLADELAAGGDRVLGLAIWFHDAVYKPMLTDNEERSAILANDVLEALGVPMPVIARVGRFILATKSHSLLEDSDALRLFLDLDLSILGADARTYDRYALAVREEFTWVPAPLYARGRRKVLLGFLARPKIYLSDAASARFESQARANIARELEAL